MAKVETFEYKLAGMRKPDTFIVYPDKTKEGWLIAQGRRTIVAIDPKTGRGVVNWRGSHYKTFLHLHQQLGAEGMILPKEFIGLVVEFRPSSGDLIGAHSETGPVYLA